MEDEVLLFLKAGIKKRMNIARKFTRTYFKSYVPITKLELNDWKQSKNEYQAFTLCLATLFGYASIKYRSLQKIIQPKDATN